MDNQSMVSILETGTVEIMTSKAVVVDYLITQLEIPQQLDSIFSVELDSAMHPLILNLQD